MGNPESLLDTYEPERRAAAEASLRLSRRMYEGYQTRATNPDDMYEEIAADYLPFATRTTDAKAPVATVATDANVPLAASAVRLLSCGDGSQAGH